MATEYLMELVGEGAKVAELQGVPGASATIDRSGLPPGGRPIPSGGCQPDR